MAKGGSKLAGGSGGGANTKQSDTFTRGNTTYQVTKDGKNFYLIMTTGSIKSKYKIAYAGNDDKARITVPYVGVVDLKSDSNILNLLKNKRNS